MTTKQSIEYGENLLKEQKYLLEKIGFLQESKDDKKTLEFLLEYLRLDLEGKVADSERKLKALRDKYEVEFEKASYLANAEIAWFINWAKGYGLKEPVSVTEKLADIVATYEREKATMSQEQRNAIYSELVQHRNFLTKTYNPHG